MTKAHIFTYLQTVTWFWMDKIHCIHFARSVTKNVYMLNNDEFVIYSLFLDAVTSGIDRDI